ncbi:MAG: glycosyltransferase, partial [Aeromicrobium sp.]
MEPSYDSRCVLVSGRIGYVKISVALGTHNGQRFVGEQIASILAQNRPVDEIVLSDDASSDRTVEIVEAAVSAHQAAHG